MTIIVVEAPAVEPVDLADMKAHLGVTFDSDDALIEAKIKAARQHVERFAGIAMVEQTLKAVLDGFPCGPLQLPRPPLIDVLSVVYLDPVLETQTLAPSAYTVRGAGATGHLVAAAWPMTEPVPGAVEITFRAGYGDDADAVPEPLREAVRRLAADLYENREASLVGVSGAALPFGVAELLADFRQWAF
jgi:uncharacterized phiE125 gp8 family phage protein